MRARAVRMIVSVVAVVCVVMGLPGAFFCLGVYLGFRAA